MTDPTAHPTFTLRLGTVLSGTLGELQEVHRWMLESTDPVWETRVTTRADVNDLDHLGWAKEWAYSHLEESTTYGLTDWIDPTDGDPEPFWVPRLVQVTHTYTVADTDGEVCTYTAESRRDAEAVNERLLHGSPFIRLRDMKGREAYVNTNHAFVIAYEVTRMEVPTE